jgi:biopolymer transport protein ExbD
MSSKSFLRSHWLLVTGTLISLLILIVGLLLIKTSEPGVAATSESHSLSIEPAFLSDLPSLPEPDRSPLNQEQLKISLENLSGDIIPADQQVSPEQLQAYLNQLETGSENWCDLMLLKADNAWTDEDAQIFAQHCI